MMAERRSIFPESIMISVVLILANLRATMFIYLHPDVTTLLGLAWIEIFLWLLVALVCGYNVAQSDQIQAYLLKWRQNWPLALFILLAFLSALWSVGSVVTLFRALELLFASLLASYIGVRYRPPHLLEFLFWFGAIVLILSLAIVYSAPRTGMMYWAPFYGAWRGVYWHRNHLASITVLINIVFLCRMINAWQEHNRAGILDGFFYVVSLVVLYFAKSATGYILLIVLHFVVFCIWLWLKLFPRMRSWHYYLMLGTFVLSLILILSNLNFVFSLFHRDSTLTGRVGLWSYLLRDVVSRHPWLGHGFGAVWTLDSFREQVRQGAAWPSQPLIADNGFLDVLLHVGLIGLSLFLSILILALVRSIRYGIQHKTVSDFFPLLVLIYALFANISFSLFAETEVFVWSLIVAVLFMATPVTTRWASQ